MSTPGIVVTGMVVLLLLLLTLAIKVVKQYEQGVVFRLGRVRGPLAPGLRAITRDDVSVDESAVAYFRVVDTVKSLVAIENVYAAIDQIAQTTLRKVVGQHTLDETLSETDRINPDIREICVACVSGEVLRRCRP